MHIYTSTYALIYALYTLTGAYLNIHKCPYTYTYTTRSSQKSCQTPPRPPRLCAGPQRGAAPAARPTRAAVRAPARPRLVRSGPVPPRRRPSPARPPLFTCSRRGRLSSPLPLAPAHSSPSAGRGGQGSRPFAAAAVARRVSPPASHLPPMEGKGGKRGDQ